MPDNTKRLPGETAQQYVARMKSNKTTPQVAVTNTSKKPIVSNTKQGVDNLLKFQPKIAADEETIVPENKPLNTPKSLSPIEKLAIDKSNQELENANSVPNNQVTKPNTNNLGNVLEYGASGAQIGLGLKNLINTPRPVDVVDPGFQRSVDIANKKAGYGLSPEESFAIDQANQGLTNDSRFNARNLSGGNAAVALSNERASANDAYTRSLDKIIYGQKIQNEKQRYADELNLQKANKMRQLFEDKMGAFQQKQMAGSALLGAGINNLIGSSRFNKAQQNIQDTNNTYGV